MFSVHHPVSFRAAGKTEFSRLMRLYRSVVPVFSGPRAKKYGRQAMHASLPLGLRQLAPEGRHSPSQQGAPPCFWLHKWTPDSTTSGVLPDEGSFVGPLTTKQGDLDLTTRVALLKREVIASIAAASKTGSPMPFFPGFFPYARHVSRRHESTIWASLGRTPGFPICSLDACLPFDTGRVGRSNSRARSHVDGTVPAQEPRSQTNGMLDAATAADEARILADTPQTRTFATFVLRTRFRASGGSGGLMTEVSP
mmetsp:Transcript_85766/g.171667  ORF Transcript_85766/g.171667 Transcript_85766/m.171667 type:complete len:253 (+) Transcript_85766:1254-2012(+)